jgi:hypothetical protein
MRLKYSRPCLILLQNICDFCILGVVLNLSLDVCRLDPGDDGNAYRSA